MSEREFEAYTKGKTMRNDTKHGESAKTTSVGFCFFPEEPEEAHRWLRGIVCDDVCVTFDVPENMVKKSVGTYSDPDESDNSIGAVLMDIFDHFMGNEMENVVYMEKIEYCCKKYSRKDFKLVKFTYSEKYQERKRLIAEWERPKEELPDGMLLQGTLTSDNDMRAFYLLHEALKKTPLRGNVEIKGDQFRHFHVILPDGRIIVQGSRVEVYEDGTVLINGSMLASGFPSLTINSGTGYDGKGYGLQLKDGSVLPVPESLFMKYDAALRQR
jgi:hypothetical protein